MSTVATWEQDAKLFGTLETNAKPYLALLCARSVKARAGQGRKDVSEISEKVSAVRFAKAAGISDKTVTSYVKVWDAMAKDEVVPARADLTPGVDVELPDKATWTRFYRTVNAAPKAVQVAEVTDAKVSAALADVEPTSKATTSPVVPDVQALIGRFATELQAVKPEGESVADYAKRCGAMLAKALDPMATLADMPVKATRTARKSVAA